MAELRTGIIGLGVGEKHILAFGGHPNCKVAAICDFSEEKLSASSRLCPDAKRTKKAREVLDDPSIDILTVDQDQQENRYHNYKRNIVQDYVVEAFLMFF